MRFKPPRLHEKQSSTTQFENGIAIRKTGNMRAHILQRALRVLWTEGPRGIVKRLRDRGRRHFSHVHLIVLASGAGVVPVIAQNQAPKSHGAGPAKEAPGLPLDFKQVVLSDEEEIDELTRVDPWQIPKSFTIEKLRQGWLCFVAKADHRTVANAWSVVNHTFKEDFLNRNFVLGSDETYYWRCFCVPSCRGEGIFPRLLKYTLGYLKDNCGRTQHVTLVRANNASMKRSLTKSGWRCVGRAGFVEILGVRFHYLWGREAFRETGQRMFFRRNTALLP